MYFRLFPRGNIKRIFASCGGNIRRIFASRGRILDVFSAFPRGDIRRFPVEIITVAPAPEGF